MAAAVSCSFDADCPSGQTCDTESGLCKVDNDETQISPALVGIAVAAAIIVGLMGLVKVAKSWGGGSNAPYGAVMVSDLGGPSRVTPGSGGGYVRIPRRLVK
jgi:hypothetical protein